jgi:hypothetical protein
MSPTDEQEEIRRRNQQAFNMTLVAVVGQVGCLTLAILLGAVFLGIWLDGQLDTRPIFTLGLSIGSIPVTLIVMVWVVRKATSRLKENTKKGYPQEEAKGGKHST